MQVSVSHLLIDLPKPVQRTDESMEETERMEGNQANDKENGWPNSCVQDKHFVSGSCAVVESEGLVLQSHNVGYEHEERQKEHNDKAVDNDDGQKPILE
jgi:hypothetical protein